MCLPDSLSRVMSLALGYQEGHLLGFYPIFRIEGAADHLDPEDWIPEPNLSKWRSSRGSDLQGFAEPFRKALSKTPQHHGALRVVMLEFRRISSSGGSRQSFSIRSIFCRMCV